jgi:multidrug efflux pump subunit AcrA (membrane-fusion protein)
MATDRSLLPAGHFATLRGLNPPRVMRVFAALVVISIAVALLFITLVPWVQTAQGTGSVIAFDPRDRQQNITALVPGRLDRWYVTDGAQVKAGDAIAKVIDIDPDFLSRLAAERSQKLAEMAATEAAMATAQRDVKRMQTLYAEGLAARPPSWPRAARISTGSIPTCAANRNN